MGQTKRLTWLINSWIFVEGAGIEPALTTIALGASVYRLHVAGITRPAVGV